MTTQSKCNEREALVALVYDDCDAAERQRLETHVTTCAACAQEVEELRAAHVAMAAWTMPEPDAPIVDRLGSDVRPWRLVEPEKEESGPAGRGPRRVFSTRWMQVAAAVIVLGVTAAMANVEVEFGSGGVVVRTGWKRSPADAGRTAQTVAAGQPSSSGGSGSSLVRSESPWRADLAGLERRLRTEFSAQAMADASARNPAASNRQGTQTPQTPQTLQTLQTLQTMSDAQLLQRVRQMIDESARLQQRELALRIAQVVREFDIQRRVDLARIEQTFGRLESVTGAEAAQQREALNYLVRVSQRQ